MYWLVHHNHMDRDIIILIKRYDTIQMANLVIIIVIFIIIIFIIIIIINLVKRSCSVPLLQ